MRDQDVITQLVDLHDHIQPPAAPADEDVRRGQRLVRRRRLVSATAVAAVVVLGVGIAQISLSDGERGLEPAPAPSPTVAPDPPDQSPGDDDAFAADLRAIVAQVPAWSVPDTQEMFHNSRCAGDWSTAASGASGGNFDVQTNGAQGQVWHEMIGFPSEAVASDAVDQLVENLTSCRTVTWQTREIGRTGAVLASSADGLLWLHQYGAGLSILSVATTDGPPPRGVQNEVAELMSAYVRIADN
jgi:hypothetical protein